MSESRTSLINYAVLMPSLIDKVSANELASLHWAKDFVRELSQLSHSFCCATGGREASFVIDNLGLWRNGSASDSRSEGWEFESLWPHLGISSLVQLVMDWAISN